MPCLPIVPRIKVVPVTSVAFYRDVAFTTVRRDEHDGCVNLASSGSTRSDVSPPSPGSDTHVCTTKYQGALYDGGTSAR